MTAATRIPLSSSLYWKTFLSYLLLSILLHRDVLFAKVLFLGETPVKFKRIIGQVILASLAPRYRDLYTREGNTLISGVNPSCALYVLRRAPLIHVRDLKI